MRTSSDSRHKSQVVGAPRYCFFGNYPAACRLLELVPLEAGTSTILGRCRSRASVGLSE